MGPFVVVQGAVFDLGPFVVDPGTDIVATIGCSVLPVVLQSLSSVGLACQAESLMGPVGPPVLLARSKKTGATTLGPVERLPPEQY